MAARHEEACYEKKHPHTFSCLPEGLSNHDVGVARGIVFQETRPGAGFKTGDFVKEKLGGLPWNDSHQVYLFMNRTLHVQNRWSDFANERMPSKRSCFRRDIERLMLGTQNLSAALLV